MSRTTHASSPPAKPGRTIVIKRGGIASFWRGLWTSPSVCAGAKEPQKGRQRDEHNYRALLSIRLFRILFRQPG